MPRIAGVDIPERKKVRYALRYIHGIGPKFADDILAAAGVDPDKKAGELSEPRCQSDLQRDRRGLYRRRCAEATDGSRTSSGCVISVPIVAIAIVVVFRLEGSVPSAMPVPGRVVRRRSPARRASRALDPDRMNNKGAWVS